MDVHTDLFCKAMTVSQSVLSATCRKKLNYQQYFGQYMTLASSSSWACVLLCPLGCFGSHTLSSTLSRIYFPYFHQNFSTPTSKSHYTKGYTASSWAKYNLTSVLTSFIEARSCASVYMEYKAKNTT